MPTAEAALTPAWLVGQRWFRAKRRPIAMVETVDRAELDAQMSLLVLGVAYADGGQDRYLVPVVDDRPPRDGDGAWRALVRRMASGEPLASRVGRFEFSATPTLEELVPSTAEASLALRERQLGTEQTNTSVVLGERLILKLYRLLEPGSNPDLEVPQFLREVGFGGTPALAGSVDYHARGEEPCAAAMLQAYVPSLGDAWSQLYDLVASDAPAAIVAAGQIGAVTAQLHAALASRPESSVFPVRLATDAELAAWHATAIEDLRSARDIGSGEFDRLVPALERGLYALRDAPDVTVQRIHGDYHLGQLLATRDEGFLVIDFEGEPARPMAERRAPGSPLRDVAGMLRSFDYLARTVERADGAIGFDPIAWLGSARVAFLAGYGGIGPDRQPLLMALEIAKALYEVRYEANNRPDLTWLPLAALGRLADATE